MCELRSKLAPPLWSRRIAALLSRLDAGRLPLALRIAQEADRVRGFGPVNHKAMADAEAAWQALDREWATSPAANAEAVT